MMKQLALVLALIVAAFETRAEETHPPVVSILAKDGRELAFGSDAILSVRLNDTATFNQITFRVDDPTAKALGKLTLENVGSRITISVCGEVITRPVVQTPIYGGGLGLTGLKREHAEEVVDVLSGSRPCG